jgi:acetylglutamate kinase
MALGASKLVLYTPEAEVLDAQGVARRQLTPHELREPAALNGPPATILASALKASEGGVERVHLVASAADGAL